jgi:hypothetical protein
MPSKIDPEIRAIAENYVRTSSNKRAVAAIRTMLEKGFVSTDDLNDLGYNHPPRAVGDVRDAGIPVITGSTTSERSGRRMAVYTLGKATDIVNGRIRARPERRTTTGMRGRTARSPVASSCVKR